MHDYSQMTDDELNAAILAYKPEEAAVLAWRGYLTDDAATWRALVELPRFDMLTLGKAYEVTFFNGNHRGDDDMWISIEDKTPARSVWLAWLQWKESTNGR